MKFIVAILAALFLFGCASKDQDDPMKKTETVTVKLPSIVCGSCAEKIEKAVFGIEGVKDVEVDVDAKEGTITFVSFQTNLETLERAITETGYDVNDKKRNPEAYAKLDACCKADG